MAGRVCRWRSSYERSDALSGLAAFRQAECWNFISISLQQTPPQILPLEKRHFSPPSRHVYPATMMMTDAFRGCMEPQCYLPRRYAARFKLPYVCHRRIVAVTAHARRLCLLLSYYLIFHAAFHFRFRRCTHKIYASQRALPQHYRQRLLTSRRASSFVLLEDI